MSLEIAVERLYEMGWSADGEGEVQRLPDGRPYPSVEAVKREFSRGGLALSVKRAALFNCAHASWSAAGEKAGAGRPEDEGHGTAVGASEAEAAVYALAQLLGVRQEQGLAAV